MRLRPLRQADLAALVRLRSQPEIMRYVEAGGAQTPAQTAQRWRTYHTHQTQHGFGMNAVESKANAEFIGTCGLFWATRTEAVELGFIFERAYWGQGYATEAAAACLGYGFGALGLAAICAMVHPNNLASRRVLAKLGLSYYATRFYQGVECYCYRIKRAAYLLP